jgi:hypothetical protein
MKQYTLDWDEIEVPAKIYNLIERNIRTLSNNSIQHKSVGSASLIPPGNPIETLDFKDMKEKWLTKKELL